jgi:hypothetical protein
MNGWPPARFRLAALAAALVAALMTAGLTMLLFSPIAMNAGADDPGVTPLAAFLRIGAAALAGAGAGALVGWALARREMAELARLFPLLQEGLPPADDSGGSADQPLPALLPMAEQVAEAARRGREASGQLARLESALSRLVRSLGSTADSDVSLPAVGPEASSAEAALGRAVQALVETSQKTRDRTGTLLAEVEDHLLPVQEALGELEAIVTADGAPAAVFLERRRLVSRARKALGQVERELSAVRLRMGGAPVERLTEADFVEPGHEENGQER